MRSFAGALLGVAFVAAQTGCGAPTQAPAPLSRAIVLGGGGSLGIAWEAGVLKALHDDGVDLNGVDLIVGTSAGAYVGALLREGKDVNALYQSFHPGASPPAAAGAGAAPATAGAPVTQDAQAQRWRQLLGTDAWPAKALDVAATDAADSSVRLFDASQGVPLSTAVAASTALPGLNAPVTVGDRSYIDGGLSGTHVDAAAGARLVAAILPVRAPGTPSEEDAVRAAGGHVMEVTADEQSLAAFGPDPMNSSRQGAAALEGFRQGEGVAANVRDFLAGKSPAATSNWSVLTDATFQTTSSGGQLAGIAVDSAGNLYAVDERWLRKVDSTGHLVAIFGRLTGSPVMNQSVIQPLGKEVKLQSPLAVAIGPEDDVYLLSKDGRIQKLSPTGDVLAAWGGYGSAAGQFLNPAGIAVAADGDVYVSDAFKNEVAVFSPTGTMLATWGGAGSDLHLDHPQGLAIQGDRLYVADTAAAQIVALSLDGATQAVIGSRGYGKGQMVNPTDVAAAPNGDLYVTDFESARVIEFAAGGRFVQQWDQPGTDTGEFFGPNAVTTDSQGDVYVFENSRTNHRIQKLTQTNTSDGR